MEMKRIPLSSLRKVIFFIAILLFSAKAFCADPNNTITSEKTKPKKQSEQKTSTLKITKPKVSPSSFNPDMPFSEALDILRNCTNPPLNIVVKWKELDEEADITPDTFIGMNGLTKVPIKTHLSVLLMTLSTESAELGYIVEGNIIVIGMKDSLPKKYVTRTYDIADIVAPPSTGDMRSGYGMGMMGGGYGNMMGGYGNTMGGYGGMSQYGTYGNQYGTGYNRGYTNQNNYYQRNRSYGYQSNRQNTSGPIILGF